MEKSDLTPGEHFTKTYSKNSPRAEISEKVSKTMYVYYNANPSGKATGDCVIRAISAITGLSWRDIHWDLATLSNEMYQMMDDNVVWHEYLRRLGFDIRPIQYPCSRFKDFGKCFPHGKYILGTGKHVVAVIDGDYYDTWDSGNEVAVFYWRLI